MSKNLVRISHNCYSQLYEGLPCSNLFDQIKPTSQSEIYSQELALGVMEYRTMKEPFYSIKAVCQLTGLTATTLHAWEKRHSVITPKRTDTNHRIYTSKDVEKLCLIVAAKNLGHSIGYVADLSLEQLKSIVSNVGPETSEPLLQSQQKKGGLVASAFCKRTLKALDAYDLERVHDELAIARNRFDAVTLVLDILVPLFSHLGRLVQQNKLGVPQEHALSAIIKANIYAESLRLRMIHKKKPSHIGRSKRIALATFDGDYHEFGILLAALLCAEHGFAVNYFGPSVPSRSLAEAVQALRIDILILSCPKLEVRYLALNPMDYLLELNEHLPKLCELWLGGEDNNLLMQASVSRKISHAKTLHDLNKKLLRLSRFKSKWDSISP